jgi:hypothetical protein
MVAAARSRERVRVRMWVCADNPARKHRATSPALSGVRVGFDD